MNIKDYLKYYIGQKCALDDGDGVRTSFTLTAYNYNYYREWHDILKPYLRPLSSMTEEEAKELSKFVCPEQDWGEMVSGLNRFGDLVVRWGVGSLDYFNASAEKCWTSDQFHYLLSRGFDLFSLIENNLALDADTLKEQV